MLEQLEEKNISFRLKKWEKKIYKYLKKLFYKNENIEEHIKRMKEQEKQFENYVQEENTNYKKLSK